MSTFIHNPEEVQSFYPNRTESVPPAKPEIILLKRVVADLYKWLDCTWAAAMIPSRPGVFLVPELHVVCREGSGWHNQSPDLICPVRGPRSTGLAAIIAMGPKKDGTPYAEQDRLFADALCCHITTLLGNDQLLHNVSETLVTVEQTSQDIEATHGICDRLDHCDMSYIPGLEYRGQCVRAERLGGDFFDVERRINGELFIAVGTVGARGMAGGIVLGGAMASLRGLARPGDSLLRIAREMNRTLWELSPEDSFTSLLCAEIDPARKCIRYVNAGHEPALIVRKAGNRVDRLDSTGAILGLSRRGTFRELAVPFEPGDMLAAFTDGVAESVGPDEVARVLREESDCAVSDLAANVLDAAAESADRTIILVRCREAQAMPVPHSAYALAAA